MYGVLITRCENANARVDQRTVWQGDTMLLGLLMALGFVAYVSGYYGLAKFNKEFVNAPMSLLSCIQNRRLNNQLAKLLIGYII